MQREHHIDMEALRVRIQRSSPTDRWSPESSGSHHNSRSTVVTHATMLSKRKAQIDSG
jgi:hypothetical protein